MKRLALTLCISLALSCSAFAAQYSGTGTVYILRSHESGYGPNVDWFSLVGVSSLGTCNKADGGYVVFRLGDDEKGQRMFTLVLAAKTSGTPLTVWVDDTFKDSGGYCYVLFMQ